MNLQTSSSVGLRLIMGILRFSEDQDPPDPKGPLELGFRYPKRQTSSPLLTGRAPPHP